MRVVRALGWLVAVVVLAAGIGALRDATQSTHYRTGPDTAVRVEVEARTNRPEGSQTLDELTEGRLRFCQLEVNADLFGDVVVVSTAEPRRYAVHLRPALDSTDRKQYRGCLEDWILDHHLVHVVSFTDVSAASVPGDDRG